MTPSAVNPDTPTFLFATCNPGWEPSLKAEMRSRHGELLTPAFLRPGLVTWKVKDALPADSRTPLPVFAHVSGFSLGMAKAAADLPALLVGLESPPDRLHVFPRVLPENGFTVGEWEKLDTGSPALTTSLVAFDCRISDARVVATHHVIIGEIVRIRLGEEKPPLVYQGRRYHQL